MMMYTWAGNNGLYQMSPPKKGAEEDSARDAGSLMGWRVLSHLDICYTQSRVGGRRTAIGWEDMQHYQQAYLRVREAPQ